MPQISFNTQLAPVTQSVPEPSTVPMLALLGLPLLRRMFQKHSK
ncbi:MAG: PEP-CTERM sorting domain-containing protein [Crocosphaera sp.]